ncbi:MAG: cytochrome ubiquinol oxidase subunit I, partial [Peptococcaceae bacterium]
MDQLLFARWQFAITTVYHFLFVPLTLGLSILVAIMHTQYCRTNDLKYRKMTKFWGKLFLINFALGVATGIVQEFQFGMNWSEYSRFVGDIFGAPLAIEALAAFFIESTFLGIWIFGWDKLPKLLHLISIWLVALASNLSAFWILVANSFMQNPQGFVLNNGRAEMVNFFDLITNPYVWHQFPHVVTAGITTAGFFVMGISAWHLAKKHDVDFFQKSFKYSVIYGLIGVLAVCGIGHAQGQFLMDVQPMKMAAAEAHWETEDPASFVAIAAIDEEAGENTFSIEIPNMLSIMTYNSFSGEVIG